MDVKVYSSPTCGYCHQAKRYLADRGIESTEYDISVDRTAADDLMRMTGQMAVPVIVVDGQTVVGFDRDRLEQLLAKNGHRPHPRFGLKVADASRMAQKLGAVPVFGALVGAVAPSSPGDHAGVKEGDIITEINLRPINNAGDLERAIAELTTGGKVTIVYMRGQQTLKAEIVL